MRLTAALGDEVEGTPNEPPTQTLQHWERARIKRWNQSQLSGEAGDASQKQSKRRPAHCSRIYPIWGRIIRRPCGWNSQLFTVDTFLEVWKPTTQKHTRCCPAGDHNTSANL